MAKDELTREKFSDRGWFFMMPPFVKDFDFWDCTILKNFLKAVDQNQLNRQKLLEELDRQLKEKGDEKGEKAEWEADSIVEDYLNVEFDGKLLKRALCASFCVAISSHVETAFEILATKCGALAPEAAAPCTTCYVRPPNPLWGAKRLALEGTIGNVSELNGHSEIQRVRIFANIFKHKDGVLDEQSAGRLNNYEPGDPFSDGQVVEYESEDWKTIVNSTEVFLKELYDKTQPHFPESAGN